jgi:hypothetical protein
LGFQAASNGGNETKLEGILGQGITVIIRIRGVGRRDRGDGFSIVESRHGEILNGVWVALL